MYKTQDINVLSTSPLITPRELKELLPATEEAVETVYRTRETIRAILRGEDPRMLAIVGPCSIHDTACAEDYASRVRELAATVDDQLFVLMRTYFGKPRTTVGWKGLINDPHIDGTYDMRTGLCRARELLLRITGMGLPTATEMLDPIMPQYLADLICWGSLGARTIESQTHREMASGLSMPVGFKNSTDGNLQVAIDGIQSARHPHHFLGIDHDGRSSVVATRGNSATHIILRGGRDHPNYDPVSIAEAEEQLRRAGLAPLIVVDCSHANSGKRCELQRYVLRSVIQQRLDGNGALVGFMLESNIHAGCQPMADRQELRYGVSITDPCLDWESTEELIRFAHDALSGSAKETTQARA